MISDHRPLLIVIAGPNGSGKTSVTKELLHHEWLEDAIYINPDIVAQEIFGDWNSQEAIMKAVAYCEDLREKCLREKKSITNCQKLSEMVDRLYLYDNSVDGEKAAIQCRLSKGEVIKQYVPELPWWAHSIIIENQ